LVYWYNLKDQVKRRCHQLCEFCLTREGQDLHHRHYLRWGREHPQDVMLVCHYCHEVIGGYQHRDGRPFHANSLGANGDDGKTDTGQWWAWLERAEGVTKKLRDDEFARIFAEMDQTPEMRRGAEIIAQPPVAATGNKFYGQARGAGDVGRRVSGGDGRPATGGPVRSDAELLASLDALHDGDAELLATLDALHDGDAELLALLRVPLPCDAEMLAWLRHEGGD
jgi:hypothetical protein